MKKVPFFYNQSFFAISPIKSIPFLKFSRDHLRSILGLRSRDHLRLGMSVAKCRGSWVVGRGRGCGSRFVGVGVGKCRG